MLRRSLWAVLVLVPLAGAYAAKPQPTENDQFFDSNGVRIHYVVRGKGEPVLLIHGFAANIGMQWAQPGILNALARDYQVIALDNRGHGFSGKPHDPRKYGAEMVEDAVRLLDHLHIKKAHVVGYSMGAIITAKLLTTHPERLRTATLGGAGAIRNDTDFTQLAPLADDLEHGKGMGRLITYLNPPGRPKPSDAEIQFVNRLLMSFNDPQALAAVVRSWPDLKVSDDALKANRVPVLAIVGDIDPLKKGVDELKGRLSNLTVVVINNNADHMTAFTRPDFLENLKTFLARHSTKKKERQAVPAAVGR